MSSEGQAYVLQTAGFGEAEARSLQELIAGLLKHLISPVRANESLDARFPNTNQTKHCWQNYVDYFRCTAAKGEDFAPCKQFFRAYHSLCPNEWIARWDEQRDAGNFPSDLSP